MNQSHSAERKIPTRTEAAVFRVKTLLLQLQRLILDQVSSRVGQFAKEERLADKPVVAESKTPLWTETEPEERFLVAGKIHNLRLAARNIDGLEIPAGEVFSFWKHVGRASSLRGFVEGRELREGCIIPNIGGGLCQLSNALYDASLQAGIEIVERHAHTQIVAGSLAEKGRDATVFWNYIDLRFRSPKPFRIEAGLDHDDLIVRFRGDKVTNGSFHKITRKTIHSDQPQSCATCEMNDCHRVVTKSSDRDFGKTAFLVDEYWPEFDDWIGMIRRDKDTLFVPIDGYRFRRANYAWTTSGFGNVKQSIFTTAIRSYQSRKLADQGPTRQQNLLATYKALADSYAKRLKFDELHVVVQQNLLPFLWKDGHLGGRTFDVMMTALPMSELQKTLDHAYSLRPESGTLGDFRAEKWLIDAENEALKHARKIVTPHSMIATLVGERVEFLSWKSPTSKLRPNPTNLKPKIVFPASTVGRKGCYELREAIRGLDVSLLTLGPKIEGADFWNGFDVQKGTDNWLDVADLVVLPAFVEHKPRRLLSAIAHGIPVIASTACGVRELDGVREFQAGNIESLRDLIIEKLCL